jgi:capsular polysaccharide transport system permease protein
MEQIEPVETSPMPIPKQKRRSSFMQQLGGINRLFLLTVALPTTLAIVYFGFLASDIYISESRFIIRSPQRQTATGLGAILQGAGFSRAQDDTYSVHDYMLSRDALQQLDKKLGLSQSFSNTSIDRVSRFAGLDPDNSFEALHRYYQKHVSISHDTASSISTLQVKVFNRDEAQKINNVLLEMGEMLVNQLSERGRQDMMRFAATEVTQAETKVKNSAQALSKYRTKNGVFDPERQSAIQLQQVSKLQDELIAAKTQLAQIRTTSRKNPQITTLQARIEMLNKTIAEESAKVAGGKGSLTDKASEYEKLALERSFAEKQLAAALATLEQARNDALRKQFYLERIVQPNKPDAAVEPRRFKAVIATLAIGMICWGILTLLLASIREHHD